MEAAKQSCRQSHTERFQFNPLPQATTIISPCVCGRRPELIRLHGRWKVVCRFCGRNAPKAKKDWQAVLNWNKSPNSRMPYWRKNPAFDLRGFQNLEDASAYMRQVRIYLEGRVTRTREQKKKAFAGKGRAPGRNYEMRLKQYLQWAIWTQAILKYWRRKYGMAKR